MSQKELEESIIRAGPELLQNHYQGQYHTTCPDCNQTFITGEIHICPVLIYSKQDLSKIRAQEKRDEKDRHNY